MSILIVIGTAGLVAMSLEVAWSRLAGVLLGPSIYAFAWVLGVFLAGIALGAAWGRKNEVDLGGALSVMGLLAVLGTWTYGQAPILLAHAFDWWGVEGIPFIELLLVILTMAGAPIASGVVFSRGLIESGGAISWIYGVNTLAGVFGAYITGLYLIPLVGLQGIVTIFGGIAVVVGALFSKRFLLPIITLLLIGFQPPWDARLYAVGIYGWVSGMADLSAEAIHHFADDGWEMLSYVDGQTGTVAVGQSTKSEHVWLSINGKVDASTGSDMETQRLSGEIPMRMAKSRERALLVGLASGVTAGSMLSEGAGSLDVVELEREVVKASHFFDHVNGRPLEDPRTQLMVEDARAVLYRAGEGWDVIVSEPSNPWITGVSSLFTQEYWQLGRARLREGGRILSMDSAVWFRDTTVSSVNSNLCRGVPKRVAF